MADLTAFAIIKTIGQNNDGSTYYLILSQNSKSCLELINKETQEKNIIIPTRNTLDDIYFMIYTFVFKVQYQDNDFSGKEMYGLFTEDDRLSLYDEIKFALKEKEFHTKFYVWKDSAIYNKIEEIKQYQKDYEVMTYTSSYQEFAREYNRLIERKK